VARIFLAKLAKDAKKGETGRVIGKIGDSKHGAIITIDIPARKWHYNNQKFRMFL
jgi:hypothetical protein